MKLKKIMAMLLSSVMVLSTTNMLYAEENSRVEQDSIQENTEDNIALTYLQGLGVIDNSISVNEEVSRGQVVTYLYKLVNCPNETGGVRYRDVVDLELKHSLIWADNHELFHGMYEGFFKNRNFEGNKSITRGEFTRLVYNYSLNILKISNGGGKSLSGYRDSKSVFVEYVKPLEWVTGNELMYSGVDVLESNEPITQLEVIRCLYKLIGKIQNEEVKQQIISPYQQSVSGSAVDSVESCNHEWIKKKQYMLIEEQGHWQSDLVSPEWIERVEHKERGLRREVFIEEQGHFEMVDCPEEGHWEVFVQEEQGHWEEKIVPDKGHIETIEHPEEGHWEWVTIPAQGHYETVTKEAVGHIETIEHPEEGHYESVKIKDSYEKEVPKYETQDRQICDICGEDVTDDLQKHRIHHLWADSVEMTTHVIQKEMQVGADIVTVPAEYEERWIVDKEHWVEEVFVIDIPEHTEQVWVETSPSKTIKKWIVDKESWIGEIFIVDVPSHTVKEWVVDVPYKEWKEWVIDSYATTVKRWVVDREAKRYWEYIVTSPAWVEEIYHEAVYNTYWVVDVEQHYKVKSVKYVCRVCGRVK